MPRARPTGLLNLLFSRERLHFMAFTVLALDGRTFAEKRIFARTMPRVERQFDRLRASSSAAWTSSAPRVSTISRVVAKWKGAGRVGPRSTWGIDYLARVR